MTHADELANEHCTPAKPGQKPLDSAAVEALLSGLAGWRLVGASCIEKTYVFKDFLTALAFVNALGGIAEEQGHHPDFFLGWGKVKVQLTTHDVGGLSRADFIMAARVERYSQLS